ncbi:MAG TPA: biopolymer transporter ExbD [Kiritimatiellia bacterium]|nr:biopolymer transporter ExbD [Kiritimatiellia bacterium]HMP00273.1 biopolymer transporter ExbD [Kiritimatiellia bacterium]
MSSEVQSVRERMFHLRPVFRSRRRLAGGWIETTPWIDAVLLVLVVFMTQTATLKKPGLQVDLPVARATTGARYDAHVLTVPQEGVYFFGDERVSWVILGDRLRDAAVESGGSELIIEADGAVSHRALIALYNLAVDAGWGNVVLASRVERLRDPAP